MCFVAHTHGNRFSFTYETKQIEILFKNHGCALTRCGYEVLGMILLCNLKGAMRLHRNKAMSAHVQICTSYEFNSLISVAWKLWLW